MTDTHLLDQLFAGADDYLTQFVTKYRDTTAAYGDDENLLMLTAALADMDAGDIAPILAVAVRRHAKEA